MSYEAEASRKMQLPLLEGGETAALLVERSRAGLRVACCALRAAVSPLGRTGHTLSLASSGKVHDQVAILQRFFLFGRSIIFFILMRSNLSIFSFLDFFL